MKKQLSFALLTISIISTNALPGQAATKIVSKEGKDLLKEKQTIVDENNKDNKNEWCAEVPWMGLFCFGL